MALVLELCGAICGFSTIAFLALAWASNSRPESEREAMRESIEEGPAWGATAGALKRGQAE
jgi:hypothetical protein